MIYRLALLAFPLLAASLPAQDHSADKLPNIIFMMADDLGYRELGSYGQTKIETPNLDRLASDGIRFTHHYSSAPVCAPARCSLITGMHGGHAQVNDNLEVGGWNSFRGQYPLASGTLTIASLLKQKGYVCGAFGKWGLGEVGSTGDPLALGFDRFFGYNCQRHAHNYYPRYLVDDEGKRQLDGNDRGRTGKQYAPELIAGELLKFIRDNKDKRFFAYYPSVIPHLALQVPDEELKHYEGRWTETAYTGKSYQPNKTPRATYAAMITYLDKQVGRILELLDELGLTDNTLIFFTSDNGTTHLKKQVDYEFFDSVGKLRGLKGSVYEGGIRVPMIVKWPGHVEPGSTTGLLSAHYDALATIADVVGAKVESDGISYLPTLLGKPDAQKRHDFLYWDFGGYGGQIAVRKGKWKGVLRNLRKHPDAKVELYDLERDESERDNVAGDHPEIVAELMKIVRNSRRKPAVKQFRFGPYK